MERLHVKRLFRHVLIPGAVPLLFFAIALSPVEVLDCRTRGLLALTVSLASGLAAVGIAFRGVKARFRGQELSAWWLLTTLVLTVPVVAMLLMA